MQLAEDAGAPPHPCHVVLTSALTAANGPPLHCQVSEEGGAPYTCAALHPDGLILCTGTDAAAVRIWETRTQKARVANSINALQSVAGAWVVCLHQGDGAHRRWGRHVLVSLQC